MAMKPKIGVMGSATGAHSKELLEKARAIGKAIAESGCILVYGATIGLPLEAAKGAKEAGGLVVGVSPAADGKEHREKYKYPTEPCDFVVYTGSGFKGRNVILTRTCDAVVIISGRIGTLNEFSNAFAEERPIGVLQGSGGIADLLPKIEEVVKGEMPTPVIYEKEPKMLVEKLLLALRK